MNHKIFLVFIFVFIFLNFVSSAHYIVGYVNDANDGESANGKTVMLWNSANGVSDFVEDIVGVSGNSHTENFYMIDCELLENSCEVGDVLSLKIIDSGDNYVSGIVNVSVTSSGHDLSENVSLNSIPKIIVNYPSDEQLINSSTVNFNVTYYDADGGTGVVSIYGNFSGSWQSNGSQEVSSGSSFIFSKIFSEGIFSFAFSVSDSLVTNFTANKTFIIDLTKPKIFSVYFNESSGCGNTSVRVSCNSTDLNGINNVIISAISEENNINQTGILYSGIYYSDFYLPGADWEFVCYSTDNAGNTNFSFSDYLKIYSGYPEIKISSSDISFNNYFPVENENLTINVLIHNGGCVLSSLFSVELYFDERTESNFVGNNTISIDAFSSQEFVFYFSVPIGKTNFLSFADYENIVEEFNESDNFANNSVEVLSWQKFYGNISSIKYLSDSSLNFENWSHDLNSEGNVFMVDSESNVNWLSLQAIGKKTNGKNSSDDFSEIDSFLGMGNYSDSVSEIFSSAEYSNFLIHKKEVDSVFVVNSSENSSFETGILWDFSDDTDGEYGISDKEDIVFVSKINSSSEGGSGTYDYEINIPAKLRDYYSEDSSEVYFYYDLI